MFQRFSLKLQTSDIGGLAELDHYLALVSCKSPVTVASIAERLQMGSLANVNTLLYHWRRGKRRK